MSQAVGGDSEIFLILYRELYYRYVYAKIQRGPSMEHRWHSYHNYQALFGYILNAQKPVKLNLPNQWLWDIIDEFVYQFQSFCQFKGNLAKRTPEELEELRSMENQVRIDWFLVIGEARLKLWAVCFACGFMAGYKDFLRLRGS